MKNLKGLIKKFALPAFVTLASVYLAIDGINAVMNNEKIEYDGYVISSYANALLSHEKYLRLVDKNKKPSFHKLEFYDLPWQSCPSKTYSDMNGDNKVDFISSVCPPYSKIYFYDRKGDYQKHKKEFDEADEILGSLERSYPLPENSPQE